MSAIIQNDPKGEIQAAIDSIVKRSLELQLALIAPCLIEGHEPDEIVVIDVLERFGERFVARNPIGHRANSDGVKIPIQFKLCARCGVAYEEKAK